MPDLEHNTVDILALHDRAHVKQRNERVGRASVGLVLGAAALLSGRRRPVTTALLATASGLLLARGLSGLRLQQITSYVQKWFSHRSDLEKRFHDGEHDIVDAASFDSFPASDPPSYSPGAT